MINFLVDIENVNLENIKTFYKLLCEKETMYWFTHREVLNLPLTDLTSRRLVKLFKDTGKHKVILNDELQEKEVNYHCFNNWKLAKIEISKAEIYIGSSNSLESDCRYYPLIRIMNICFYNDDKIDYTKGSLKF